MSATALVWTEHVGLLRPSQGVIDSHERMQWAQDVLCAYNPAQIVSRLCTPAEAELAHDAAYVRGLAALGATNREAVLLDPELCFDAALWQAAQGACAAVCDAALAAWQDSRKLQVCLSRPGSHHAAKDFALGGCVLNNLAVAARAVLAAGAQRVAILDFDAHHGNGTQDIFWADSRVLTVSLHQYPFFPGSGAASEQGTYNTVVNLPLPAATEHHQAVAAYAAALAQVQKFRPQLILVEAGLDAHHSDWTSDLCFTNETFACYGEMTRRAATELACGVVMEVGGGYTETALREGLEALLWGWGLRP